MKKRLLFAPLLFALVFVFAFSGCTSYRDCPLEIDGAYIPPGVYCYYLDLVLSSPKKYGAKKDDRESVMSAAETLCKNYVAAQSYALQNKITLEQDLKSEASSEADGKKALFGAYYQKIGVSKADLYKVCLSEKYKKEIVRRYFGAGGKKEVSTDKLKEKFVELYVGFKAIEAPLTKVNTKGETGPLSSREKADLEEEFEKMAKRLNSGADIDSVNESYCKKMNLVATQKLEINVISKSSSLYDEDFFEKIEAVPHGSAAVIESGSWLYLVERFTIATNDDDAFEQYRSEVLESLKMPWVEKTIASAASKYNVTTREKRAKKLFEIVLKGRESFS